MKAPFKGEGSYQGKHWMQDPANKAKMLKMVRKMQTGAARARSVATRTKNNRLKKLANTMAKDVASLKRVAYKKTNKKEATALVINGWRITLGNGEIRIDNE